MSSVLVVGGAGYIGSHMVKRLADAGHRVTVFDNLSRGFRDAVLVDDFVHGDLRQLSDLSRLFQSRTFDVVMHFAALAYVGESVENPALYYENNVIGAQNLLEAMRHTGVDKLVFSSTCAIYGVPRELPITEDCPQQPVNPYGRSKRMFEEILADYASAYGLNSVALRYFNAAGCDPEGLLGERHDPETHLIPLVLQQAARIRSGDEMTGAELQVFGDDYNTADGTCVRDYIHVNDLCQAHLLAMQGLLSGELTGAEAFNLGNGQGFSVKEVIETCSQVTGVEIPYQITDRRAGDPPVLIGSSEKAHRVLAWVQDYVELEKIVETAWYWIKINENDK